MARALGPISFGLLAWTLVWAGEALAAGERCVAISNGSGKAAWVAIRNPKCETAAQGFADICAHGGLDDGHSASFCPRAELEMGRRFSVTFIQEGRQIPCEDIELSQRAHLAGGGTCVIH